MIVDERELRVAREHREYRSAYADWIGGKRWTHFITLTTARPIRSDTVLGSQMMLQMVRDYIRAIGGHTRKGTPYVGVLEHHADGMKLHAHLLIDGTAHLSSDQIEALWREGISHAEIFDPERGPAVAAYLAKGLLDADADMWFCSRREFRRTDTGSPSMEVNSPLFRPEVRADDGAN